MKLKHIALIGSLFPILFSLVLFFGVLISADSDDENSNFSSGITGMNLSADLAMYQKNGQPAEKILRYYFQARFVRPKVRPYQTRNYYALLVKGDDAHDSVSEKE